MRQEFEGDPNYVRHEELQEFIDISKVSIKSYRSGLRRNDPRSIPSFKRVAALYLNLLKYVKTEINQGDWATIDNNFRTFYTSYQLLVGLTQDFNNFKKLFACPQSLSFDELKQLVGPSRTKTPIREALRTWIGNIFFSEFPRYKTSKGYRGFDNAILSRVIYQTPSGRRTGIFKGGYEYVNLYKLFELLYRTEEITVTWLQQLGIAEADEYNVQRLKDNIKRVIKNFIISNPFSTKYIHSDMKYISRDPSYFEPEFDLCLELYITFSKENNKPLSLKEFAKQLGGYPGFTFHQAAGPMKWRTLKKLIGEFRGNYYRLGVLQKRLSGDNYRRASSAIRTYLKERTVSPHNTEYHEDWALSGTVDSHIIILLLRDLGIEIQGLDEIETRSFVSSIRKQFLFIRHHIFKNDKMSIDPNRLVLTITALHNSLENFDGNLITSLVDQMLDWSTDACPKYYKNLFPKTWKTKWQEVIDRRNFIKKEGVGEFLLQYYPDAVKRIFGYSVKKASTVESRIKSILNNWANEYGSMPKLPNIILNKLGLATTQTQITNFLGNLNPNP